MLLGASTKTLAYLKRMTFSLRELTCALWERTFPIWELERQLSLSVFTTTFFLVVFFLAAL
jgi:hypothetical protein